MIRNLNKFGFNLADLLSVYIGYVRPLLEYSDVIWHSSLNNKQSRLLESIRKRACKIILGRHYISYSNAIDVCNLQTLSARREAHCLSFANSLAKSERTSKLLPRTRKDVSRLEAAEEF